MINGISGAPIPQHLRYAVPIQQACEKAVFPPCLAYAIAWRESISGEIAGLWSNACSVVAPDFGYGLFQLTYPFEQPWPPADWEDAGANTTLAIKHYLQPGLEFFASRGMHGDQLVRCIAAGFNSGNETAWDNHILRQNVDYGTTDGYAAAVYGFYTALIAGKDPA